MKQFFTYFFALLISATTLANLFLLADYAVRYTTYANELCENKDRPELNCDGKCQFAKIMNQHSEPEKPQLNQIVEVVFVADLLEFDSNCSIVTDVVSRQKVYTYNDQLPVFLSQGIPTPPPKLS